MSWSCKTAQVVELLLWRNLGCVAGKNTIQWQFQSTHATDAAGVDEIKRISIPQDEELHDEGADDEQIRRPGE